MTVPALLAARLEAAGQTHVVAGADALTPAARERFLAEVAAVPWERLRAALDARAVPLPPDLRAPAALTLRRQRNAPGILGRLAAGAAPLLARGGVGAVLLAGGQGTRLGHPGPKGSFALGPGEDRTLYAIHAERVAAVGRRAGRPAPLAILVGRDTEEGTRDAFAHPARHGLAPDQVRIVRQGELPAVDDAGRALLAEPGRLALAPDGHGGLVEALRRDGALAWFAERGVEVLVTFQVDNPLARPLDPVFLGWLLERRAEAGGKAVRKRVPDERVGVFARDLVGRVRVVEYSEMPEGGLPDLVLGSIAVHAFSLPWLRATAEAPGFALPWHRARKRVACLAPDGPVGRALPASEAPTATKLEQFLFDLLPLAPRTAIHEVDRRREFAPVKNATGEDSPETARALVAAEIARWHREAGLPVPDPVPPLCPLVADGPEDLRPRDGTR